MRVKHCANCGTGQQEFVYAMLEPARAFSVAKQPY